MGSVAVRTAKGTKIKFIFIIKLDVLTQKET